MQVRPERLAEHLRRGPLARCFLVFGSEPLQSIESADAVRHAARAAGAGERLVFDATVTPDWRGLTGLTSNLSLFAEQRLIEIRLGGRKPDKTGAEALAALAAAGDGPDVYLIIAEQLDRQQQASGWFKACDRHGVVVQSRELDLAALKSWIAARAGARGLRLAAEAVDFLAVRGEGNLLAAGQEIDKLALLAATPDLGLDEVMVAVTDSARYDVFQCVDAALAGAAARAVRIVRGIREEGTDAIVLGWSLTRELRTLLRVAAAQATGTAPEAALAAHNVWASRQSLVRRALQRHPVPRLTAMLEASIRIDQLIKGSGVGNVWDELESLVLALAGGPWLHRPVTAT